MSLDFLFNAANLFVLPFWALMILLPNWGITRKVMQSFLPFVALAGLYIYLFAGSITPETADDFSNPQLADIARLFSSQQVAATGWVHFSGDGSICGSLDLLGGTADGRLDDSLSYLFACLQGPLGLLSHIVTSWISKLFSSKTGTTPEETSPDLAA